jgi:hypothetical protein
MNSESSGATYLLAQARQHRDNAEHQLAEAALLGALKSSRESCIATIELLVLREIVVFYNLQAQHSKAVLYDRQVQEAIAESRLLRTMEKYAGK